MKVRSLNQTKMRAWLLALGVMGLQGSMLDAQPKGGGPAPLDPLTPGEIQSARGVADLAPAVTGRIGGHRYVLGSIGFLLPPKPGDPSAPPADGRYAEVLYCVYADNTGLRALVDLTRGAVWATEDVSCDQVPIAPEEIQLARDLALADLAVRDFLGGAADLFQPRRSPDEPSPEYVVEALKVVASESDDRCYGQRCVVLLFSDSAGYRTGLEVLANLTTLTITTTPVEPTELVSTHAHRKMLKAKAGKASHKARAPRKGNG